MQTWIAVLIAAIIQMALGAFWYSPVGFGKMWMKEMNYKVNDMKKASQRMGKLYLAAFIGSLITAFVLSRVILLTNTASPGAGAAMGLLLWLGFIVPVMLGSVLWEQRSVKAYIINIAYHLVALLAMGAVIGLLV